jgi:hypothetical protein
MAAAFDAFKGNRRRRMYYKNLTHGEPFMPRIELAVFEIPAR